MEIWQTDSYDIINIAYFCIDSDSTVQAGGRINQFTPVYRKAESLSPRPLLAISPLKHTLNMTPFNINSIQKPLIVPPPTASPSARTDTGSHVTKASMTLTSDPAQAFVQKSADESNLSDYESQVQTGTQSEVQTVTRPESQTDTQSEIEDQSDDDHVTSTSVGEHSYPYGLTADFSFPKKSSKSHRTTKTGLSLDTYHISSSGTLPMSRYTHSKSRLSSSLTNLTQSRAFDAQTVRTESNYQMDRHSDTDIIIKVDQVDSLESQTNGPITIPVFPTFSVGQPQFASTGTSLNSKLNSVTTWRLKSGNSVGSFRKL